MYSRILLALDGSGDSLAGGRLAHAVARRFGAEIVAAHIYDTRIHATRFREMEPVLPQRYQEDASIDRLREAHRGLMGEGFEALSRGYLEQYSRESGTIGTEEVAVREVHRRGRNYLELLRLAGELKADLLVLGALGLGAVPGDTLGSTALRVLRLAPCDVLVARQGAEPPAGVTAGIDGSGEALAALRRAAAWARALEKPLELAAAYDPFFHGQVFKAMAASLSAERQREVGINRQQSLHDQIIDDGLGKLYRSFLDQALELCGELGVEAEARLLQGKAGGALRELAASRGGGLLVVGRYGHHREDLAGIGSTSEALCRMATASVLVVGGVGTSGGPRQERPESAVEDHDPDPGAEPLPWEEGALKRLGRIPPFARPMARSAIERLARERGKDRVGPAEFEETARRFGMGPVGEPEDG